MKIALVCDSMSAFGGAERVVEQILAAYPQADVFSVLDTVPASQRGFLQGRSIRTSFLQRLPGIARYYRHLLQFWPLAVEQLDVSDYDLVISSHHSVAYGVLTRPGQTHLSYVHSPMRYAWDLQHQYLREARLDRGLLGIYARRTLHQMRLWDYAAAQRPDHIACNAAFVAERMWKLHRREASVIHPPVAVDLPPPVAAKEDYYISVGRLVPYKRIELLARAFREMPQRRLKIVGDGPDARRIAALAAPNIEILGFQPTARVRELLAGARAFLFAGIEDFGITPVEAQALGTPVIAYRAGGLLETVNGPEHPRPTGLFFDRQDTAAIIAAVAEFEAQGHRFTAAHCRDNAQRFSEQRFRAEFTAFVEQSLRPRPRQSGAMPERRPLSRPVLAELAEAG